MNDDIEAVRNAHTSWEHGPDGWVFTVNIPLDAPDEVLNHELAHIRQRVRYGIDVEVHGLEFDNALGDGLLAEVEHLEAENERLRKTAQEQAEGFKRNLRAGTEELRAENERLRRSQPLIGSQAELGALRDQVERLREDLDAAEAENERLRAVKDTAQDVLDVLDLRRVGVVMHAEERRSQQALRTALAEEQS